MTEEEATGLSMVNLSRILRARAADDIARVYRLLSDLAQKTNSEAAFLMAPSTSDDPAWQVPEGWCYSENELPVEGLSFPRSSSVVGQTLEEESIVIDTVLKDVMPPILRRKGIKSLIAARIGYPETNILCVCNSKQTAGRNFRVSYTLGQKDLAISFARMIRLNRPGRPADTIDVEKAGQSMLGRLGMLLGTIVRTKRKVPPMPGWKSEKAELLKSHPGWFVAYEKSRRVALAPTLAELDAQLDARGTERRPCEFHRIVERPLPRRGPSPRLKGLHRRN